MRGDIYRGQHTNGAYNIIISLSIAAKCSGGKLGDLGRHSITLSDFDIECVHRKCDVLLMHGTP